MSKPSAGGEYEKGYAQCPRCKMLRPEVVLEDGVCRDWGLCNDILDLSTPELSDVEYEDFVLSVWKKFEDPGRELLVVGLGVAGEAGEFADLIKKAETYDRPVDRAQAVKELGDVEYYLGVARRRLGITREEILRANMEKLKARHPAGFNVGAEKVKAREIG